MDQEPRSKFMRIVCRKCQNEQITFNKASTLVKCLKCGNELVIPMGGDAEIKGRVSRKFP